MRIFVNGKSLNETYRLYRNKAIYILLSTSIIFLNKFDPKWCSFNNKKLSALNFQKSVTSDVWLHDYL